jgi:hypothetical protein
MDESACNALQGGIAEIMTRKLTRCGVEKHPTMASKDRQRSPNHEG